MSRATSFNVEACRVYLLRNFDPSITLIREAPNAAPKMYWLLNDNYVAWLALRGGCFEADLIHSTVLQYLTHPSDFARVILLDGGLLDPTFPNTVRKMKSFGEKSLQTESVNQQAAKISISDYADIALYNCLYLFNQGLVDESEAALANAEKLFWDGRGFKDKSFDGRYYQLYKNALYLIAINRLGVNGQYRSACETQIAANQTASYNNAFQNQQGGCLTEYDASGKPDGDTNTETASLCIIAMRDRV